ncbi:AlpA family phage regulatory protein [Bradyrhizobium sp. B117]|uniref:helix-turn-helix transcriptional regulator n=1 Tax=Bradyrhizobium sp. B117 TaxID=3140246 RepID=UPI003182E3BC
MVTTSKRSDGRELRPMLTEQMVLELVPISRTTLFRLERAGKFPRSVYVSPNRRFWFRDQVIAWQTAINDNDERNLKRGRGKGRRRRSDRF